MKRLGSHLNNHWLFFCKSGMDWTLWTYVGHSWNNTITDDPSKAQQVVYAENIPREATGYVKR